MHKHDKNTRFNEERGQKAKAEVTYLLGEKRKANASWLAAMAPTLYV
jgi:hypothetical protein